MDARERRGDSSEKANPRKRPYAELYTRRPGRTHHLPLHLDSESPFAQAPSESLNRNFPPPSRLRRYEGDGLDLRRPIMSGQRLQSESQSSQTQTQQTNASNDVIDLTDEPDVPSAQYSAITDIYETSFGFPARIEARSLLPARTPEVIDLEDIEDDNDDDVILQEVVNRPADVEFVSEQRRSDRPQETRTLPGTWRSQTNSHPPWFRGSLAGLTNFMPQTRLTGLHQFTQFLNRNSGRRNERDNMFGWLGDEENLPAPPQTDWLRAGAMDFTQVAFELGNPQEVTRPATAAVYEAPPAPPDGFTRTVQEDDTVICANCDRELGTGDSPVQKQIYVIRKCGHAYCGSCVIPQKSKKRLISKCVANGCGNPIKSAKSCMVILYI